MNLCNFEKLIRDNVDSCHNIFYEALKVLSQIQRKCSLVCLCDGNLFFRQSVASVQQQKKIKTCVELFFIRQTFFMRRFEKGGKARAESSRRSRTSLQASEQASFDGMRLSGDKCDDDEPEPGAKTNEGLGLGSRAL